MKILITILSILVSFQAQAKLLRIIHTNDLHSYFKGYKDGRGGYAKLKTKIDELKAESQRDGIETLQIDGGDFGEGTSFFMSREGVASVEALGMLGTEITVIGNHDHMMGGKILSEQIRKANVSTKFLSANIVQTPEMDLKGIVFPHADVEKAGIKIRVIGLSTPEPHFQYPLLPGFILPAVPVGKALSEQARKDGNELVIALTHIGVGSDESLAKDSKDIDLIVGGHSHTRLDEMMKVKNRVGRYVPIVQTGAHGLAVGSLLLDVQGPGKMQVLEYKLHDIKLPIDEDQTMANFVMEAAEDRNQYFGGRWEEIIGETLIPMSGYKNGSPVIQASCWGEHMAKMSRESTGADLGIHLAFFEGAAMDPGKITFGDMIENFPHFRNYGEPGWEISTITVKGKILKVLLRAFVNLKHFGVNFYGVKYKAFYIPYYIPWFGGKQYAYGFRVNGQKISDKGTYKIAFPSEIGLAMKLSLPDATKKLMPDLTNSGHFYWDIMEEYIKRNSPISCLNEKSVPILSPD